MSESKQNTITKKTKVINRFSDDYESSLKRHKSEEKSRSNIWDWNNVNSSKSESIVFQADIDKALSVSFEKPNDYELNDDNNMYSYDESSVIKSNKKFKEPLYDVFFFMQMEFCDGLPLNEYLDNNKYTGVDAKIIFSFFKQIVSGVNHIHKNNVIHRDLKYLTSNIDLIIFLYLVRIV
jgi:translation initiation factor 2-alpha kinase 4